MNYRVLFGVALCAAFPGCFVEAGDGGSPGPVVVDSGSLVLDWTIDGTKEIPIGAIKALRLRSTSR
jgi:hypothetical protein